MASPTALYAFYGNTGTYQGTNLMGCSPIGPNCNFVSMTLFPTPLSWQFRENIVIYADPNNAKRVYIGGGDYTRADVSSFTTGATTYFDFLRTTDNTWPHVDGRVLTLDANGDLLEGDATVFFVTSFSRLST